MGINLTANDKAALTVLAGFGEECFLGFGSIAADSGIERRSVRRVVRRLARAGYAKFAQGLTDEDGNFRGAGYAITDAGRSALAPEATSQP